MNLNLLSDEKDDPFLERRRTAPPNLTYLKYTPKPRRILTTQEVMKLRPGSDCTCDTELFTNYFFAGFKHLETGTYFYFDKSPDHPLNIHMLTWCLYMFRTITFNGINYDVPIIQAALGIVKEYGSDFESLKNLNDAIIHENFRARFTFPKAPWNHIDLVEVAPLKASLKTYGGRMHCQRMQEIPHNPNKDITPAQSAEAAEYCFNDLDNTEMLFEELRGHIKMREEIGRLYEDDFRSKSDAQMAEAAIVTEFKRIHGYRPRKPDVETISLAPINYRPPDYIKFETPQLQNALEAVKTARFSVYEGYVRANGSPLEGGIKFQMGHQIYNMKIGGLHSTETKVTYRANDEFYIADFDVASYYPTVILSAGIFPQNMGQSFLTIYRKWVDRRIAAKKAKNMVEADGLKVFTNGTFGKLGSPYSVMYSPELMLYITITGQWQLLMLIERGTLLGYEVINANTDGVVFKIPRARQEEFQRDVIQWWEATTKFTLEETRYRSYHARDVNNYIAVKEDGEVKCKGAFTEKGSTHNSRLSKNPETLICSDAVKAFLKENDKAIEATIRNCRDVRRFVTVRKVNGGAHKSGIYLGKVVRWYYAVGETGTINYVLNGNTVGNTEGAKPLMELPDQLPSDLDFEWYINKALEMLASVGYFQSLQKRLI